MRLLVLLLFLPVVAAGADLRTKIGRMLLVGFRGTELADGDHIVRDIRDHKIGGVILFDYDAPTKKYGRNIESPEQLKKLTGQLMALDNSLIVSIDQEGGRVDRLKARYGFPATVSAARLGKADNADTTRRWAASMALTLREAGVNVNFAPCVDMDINPACPVIGAVERSFSADPRVVVRHAEVVLEELGRQGVMGCLKHFPGHGSSTKDTHLAAADVTGTWCEQELRPYEELIHKTPLVMTSHIFNARLDPDYPATMSHAVLTGLLRGRLGYRGVIVTDDLAMGALADNFPLEVILERAIMAGADLLCLSNNGAAYDPDIVPRAVDIIERAVVEGRIPIERIDESYRRILRLELQL